MKFRKGNALYVAFDMEKRTVNLELLEIINKGKCQGGGSQYGNDGERKVIIIGMIVMVLLVPAVMFVVNGQD